jgi:hypothetical protein
LKEAELKNRIETVNNDEGLLGEEVEFLKGRTEKITG